MKKERPILFSTPMVKAIIAGSKTQTRRVVNPQPELISNNAWCWAGKRPKALYNTGSIFSSGPNATPKNDHSLLWACPYGNPGDVMWVRETWQILKDGFVNDESGKPYCYKADATNEWLSSNPNFKWKPSIHMPKKAARIWLEITNVRVERLQDISNDDSKAEGISKLGNFYKDYNIQLGGLAAHTLNPKESFKSLWELINGENSFEINPWVWVIEFKQIKK